MEANGRSSSILREIYRIRDGVGHLAPHLQQLVPAQIQQADLAFARATIVGIKPFSLYEGEYMKDAFTKLGTYRPPLRGRVGGVLLDSLEVTVRQRIRDEILKPGDSINVVADGSTNITGTRIQNVSLVTMDGRSFHWNSIDMGNTRETADELKKLIVDQIIDMVGDNNFNHVNSFASNTCNTMGAV
jgi:hypothetical protein